VDGWARLDLRPPSLPDPGLSDLAPADRPAGPERRSRRPENPRGRHRRLGVAGGHRIQAGRAPWTRRRARLAGCRATAGEGSTMGAFTSYGTANTSCRDEGDRSAGSGRRARRAEPDRSGRPPPLRLRDGSPVQPPRARQCLLRVQRLLGPRHPRPQHVEAHAGDHVRQPPAEVLYLHRGQIGSTASTTPGRRPPPRSRCRASGRPARSGGSGGRRTARPATRSCPSSPFPLCTPSCH
jgi:hypothetical protein